MKRSFVFLVLALAITACHPKTPPAETPSPVVTSADPAPAPTGDAASDQAASIRATGESCSCGLPMFETARGTRVGLPALPRVERERLGAFEFLSHIYEATDLTLALDEFRLPTDTGDGRAMLEPLANGIASQSDWQLLSQERRTVAGNPALVRAYRLEDGTIRREVYVARHRVALRLVAESAPTTSGAHTDVISCFEASLALPRDVL